MNETEDQARIRKAKEAIASCQENENNARRALALAVESTKRARERFEELFNAVEAREVARLRAEYNLNS